MIFVNFKKYINNIFKYLTYFFNIYKNDDKIFKNELKFILGFTPKKLSLYKIAFSHSSIKKEVEENNERLEFLGDNILDSIISEYLYKKYPFKNEGFLTEMKSKIVNRQNLNAISHKLNLKKYIQCYQNINVPSTNLLGNTLEALIGAIYLDIGYYKTYNWIIKNIIYTYVSLDKIETIEANAKNKLLQWASKNNKTLEYKVLNEEKNNNNKIIFTIGVFINNELIYTSQGYTKKEAENSSTIYILSTLVVTKEQENNVG